jgi:hypothetical protein
MRTKMAALAAVDQHSRQTAEQIEQRLTTYQTNFRAVAEAWRRIGLDENSGLQGAFRQKVHRLQELSAQYYVDPLYTTLLQIRRSEKRPGLTQGSGLPGSGSNADPGVSPTRSGLRTAGHRETKLLSRVGRLR